jgi:hypothetical protein
LDRATDFEGVLDVEAQGQHTPVDACRKEARRAFGTGARLRRRRCGKLVREQVAEELRGGTPLEQHGPRIVLYDGCLAHPIQTGGQLFCATDE